MRECAALVERVRRHRGGRDLRGHEPHVSRRGNARRERPGLHVHRRARCLRLSRRRCSSATRSRAHAATALSSRTSENGSPATAAAASTGGPARGAASSGSTSSTRITDVILFLDVHGRPHRLAQHTRPDDPRGRVARPSLSPAQGPRGRRELRRLPLWLLPASGTRQLYRIVDSLLQMDVVLSFATGDRHPAAAHCRQRRSCSR